MKLKAFFRKELGKKVRALRRKGYIPAELYGHKTGNQHLAVAEKEFKKVFKEAGENTIIDLEIENIKHPVLIYDIQRHYLDREIIHIDFYEVRADEKIRTLIPLEFIGTSPAVKEKGAVLNKAITAIEVESLPKDIPRYLEVDLSLLQDVYDSFYVKDLKLPEGVKAGLDPETVIVTAVESTIEEEEAGPMDVSEVKVEGEGERIKKQEEQSSEKD